jgi:prolipoprotein diacylglyceryltransferase
MEFPLNFQLGEKVISTHFVAEIVAIFIGVRYYTYLRRNTGDKISKQNRLIIFAAVCFGALIGSRLVGVFENPPQFFSSPGKFVYIFSNKTIIGGLLGGLLSVEIIKKKIGVTSSSGDLMVYPIILGLIIGRIGCFCEGLSDGTMGHATDLFTGIDFGDRIYRHPMPLYEIVFLIALWIGLRSLESAGFTDGAKFKLFMISYLMFRFFIEFLKENNYVILSLSVLQLSCLAGLIYYSRVIAHPKKLFLRYA